MSWEAYDNIIVCYDMNIKCKMSKNLLRNRETVVLFNKQIVLFKHILFSMNASVEYFNIDVHKKIPYC